MVPRGGLIPIQHGFEIYIRDTRFKEMEIADTEPTGLLSRRQRFTLAHEIAHTYFYNLSAEDSPKADMNAPKGPILENLCDAAASQIMVPTEMLKRRLQSLDEFNIDFVQDIATSFNVSLTVALRRLGALASSISAAQCVILAHRRHDDSDIQACCFGTGLLRILPRPTRFAKLGEWVPSLPHCIKSGEGDCEWKMNSAGGPLLFEKKEIGSDETFMLQVKELENDSPDRQFDPR